MTTRAASWLRRLIWLFLGLIWLAFLAFPVVAFILATQGEIRLGNQTRRQMRVFLVQEASAEGLGFQWTRPAGRDSNCTQSQLAYLLWAGQGDQAAFCRCFDGQGRTILAQPGTCPAD